MTGWSDWKKNRKLAESWGLWLSVNVSGVDLSNAGPRKNGRFWQTGRRLFVFFSSFFLQKNVLASSHHDNSRPKALGRGCSATWRSCETNIYSSLGVPLALKTTQWVPISHILSPKNTLILISSCILYPRKTAVRGHFVGIQYECTAAFDLNNVLKLCLCFNWNTMHGYHGVLIPLLI